MKRFAWRLQRVLDVKTKEEQVKNAELVNLTGRLAETRGALLNQQRILQDLMDAVAGKGPSERLGEQELLMKCSSANEERIQGLRGRVQELELEQKELIGEVQKIRRFKQGLEKLRENAKRQFIEHEEKLEQKELDEAACIGFRRKMNGFVQG